MYQALYRKWRPLRFADVIGQQHITDTLRVQMKNNRLSHAYLFTGTRGTGKTTCAKILARAVNCQNPQNGDPCNECQACRAILEGAILDVVEIDAASNNGVDNIREIRDEVRYAPSTVSKKVFIIDEVHMLSPGAFNALLKTLEEPPEHVLFILATTELQKVPATILSRCQRFDFRRITPQDIAERLRYIAAEERLPLTEGGAKLIARLADGAMRDALSMLDRAAGCDSIDEDAISRSLGILASNDSLALMQAIKDNDLVCALELIGRAYDSGRDLVGVFDQLLGLLRDLLLTKTAGQGVSSMLSPAYTEAQLRMIGEGVSSSTLLAYSKAVQDAISRIKAASNRRVEAELCLVSMCTMLEDSYDSLTGRVEALEEKMRHGITVTTSAPVSAPQLPNDAPPWEADEKQSEPPKEETKKANRRLSNDWAGWMNVVERARTRINIGAYTCLQLSSRAELDEDTLRVYCENDVVVNLAKDNKTLPVLTELVQAELGKPVRVRIYGPDDQPKKSRRSSGVNEILDKAKAFEIDITEF